MSEALEVALIAGGAPTLAIVARAVMSHLQHKKTDQAVQAIHVIVNNQRSEMMDQIKNLTEMVAKLKAEADRPGRANSGAETR